MWIKDASGRYVAASKSYFHFDPSAEGNIIGKMDAECFPPEKATVYVADDRIAIETGASEGEFTAVGDDGKLRTFLTKKVVLRAPDGSVAGTLGVSRDITERKQAEEALRQSEAKYRLLIDTASESIVVVQDGLLKFVNLMTLAVLGGYSEQELINRPFPEFVHLDDRSMVVENYRRRIANEAEQPPPRYAFRVISRDGIVKWVEINAALIEWQGKPATLNFLTDITERKQAEEALLQARDDWESTFDSLTDMVTIHDKNYDIIRANSSARQMLGLPLLGNLITKAKCFMCYHGTEKPPEGCPSCRSLVTEQPCSFELFEPHLNRYLEIRAIPRFDTHHQCIGLVHVVRDITERKQAEEESQRERAFFDQLIETAPEGIAITDTQGSVMRVNAEFVRMFGYEVDEAVGQSIDDLVVPPARQEEARELTKSTGQGSEILLETVRRKKDGTLVDVSLIGAPILIAGKQEALYAIYRDITERKQAEAQLRQSQKMEAIGTLAGGVAHDFNNLLAGILGNIALMRSSLPPADPLLENLNAAETSARQAADLTKGLLTFSRSAMVLPVPMNITVALDATLVLLKQSLPATMEIARDYEQTAWNVLLDQSQLTQILLNLAVNARDAMKGKGALTIRMRNVTVDTAYVHEHSYARTGEFVRLSVSDTGPGIPPAILEHIFEPFHTTKPVGSGTGLGLSIVYGAVKQAGGWITAVSTEGVGKTAPRKHPSEAPLGLGEHPRGDWENILGSIEQTCSGATFDIYLPRCLDKPKQSFTPSSLSVNVCRGTILVVEDEPVVCAVAQAFLSKSGCAVLTAVDGASAIDILKDQRANVELVLLDMTMPGMTTGEVVQAIRALDPTVPILLNSGYTSNGTVKRMLDEGTVQGFLGKPYELSQLLERIQQLLHRG
jgi:PAS domain S-box-containing protein